MFGTLALVFDYMKACFVRAFDDPIKNRLMLKALFYPTQAPPIEGVQLIRQSLRRDIVKLRSCEICIKHQIKGDSRLTPHTEVFAFISVFTQGLFFSQT